VNATAVDSSMYSGFEDIILTLEKYDKTSGANKRHSLVQRANWSPRLGYDQMIN
jgi:hypothetical protein